MNDNDIIKALERCIKCNDRQIASCDGCLLEKYYPYCDEELEIMCLDLINRQKAEIKDEIAKGKMCAEVIARQDKELEDLREIVFIDRTEAIKNLKAEAIKEFAERLKDIFGYGWVLGSAVKTHIDNLVKEMTVK